MGSWRQRGCGTEGRASRAVDCPGGRLHVRVGGWRLIVSERSVAARAGRERGGAGAGGIDWEGFKSLRRSAGALAKRALLWADHLYSAGPCFWCCVFCFACCVLRICFVLRELSMACVSSLRGACYAVFRVCVNASACLGCGCVGSCPPLRSYRCVACGRSIQSSRVESHSR